MITREHFGVTSLGEDVSVFTLTNAKGATIKVLNYGCVLQSIVVPDKSGAPVDVCLGFDTMEEYESRGGCFGAVVGRCANRIRKGEFSIGAWDYFVSLNARGEHHIHGGVRGFHKLVWRAEAEGDTLRLSRLSPEGEEGYPGNLHVTVEYTLSDDNVLGIRYWAATDADTIVNLTNHCYFNLNGHGSGSAMEHVLRLNAEEITEADEAGMSNGNFLPAAGTCFDFRAGKPLSEGLDGDHPQMQLGHGYDQNFVLSGEGLREVGVLTGDQSGISMAVWTDQPGVQLYSANNVKGFPGKGGAVYERRGAVCLETQHYPNSPEHPHFPSVVLRAGEIFESETQYRFSVD